MPEKTIINAWSQHAPNAPKTKIHNFWGLGDLLRGSNVLFEVSKELEARYVLDISGHPLSAVFKSPSLDVKRRGSPAWFWKFQDVDHVRQKIKRAFWFSNTLRFNTNGGGAWPTVSSDEWRLLVKETFTPGKRLSDYLAQTLPTAPYRIIHMRLGDSAYELSPAQIEEAFGLLVKNMEDHTILVCDRKEFKDLVRQRLPELKISVADPVHIGLNESEAALIQTMGDFFLIGGATQIKTYSVYAWTSGFVVSASRVFDVPLTEMVAEEESPRA